MCGTASYQQKDRERGAADLAKDDAKAKTVAILRAVSNPTERLLTAYGHARVEWQSLHKGRVTLDGTGVDVVIRDLFPLWDQSRSHKWPWDSGRIAQWFATEAKSRGVKTDGLAYWETYSPNFFGKPRLRSTQKPAWSFDQATYEGRSRGTQHVFVDGYFSPSAENDRPLSPREANTRIVRGGEATRLGLSPETLHQMAKRLALV